MQGMHQAEANIRLFGDLVVTVVSGQRVLGGFIGDKQSTDEYVEQKVQVWI